MRSASGHGYLKEINGLGGATSSTSKIVILSPSKAYNVNVDYLFGHVSINQPLIDYSGNCGNLSSAVDVFALEQGWFAPHCPCTEVRVWQVNLSQAMVIHVPCDGPGVVTVGDYEVAGVSGTVGHQSGLSSSNQEPHRRSLCCQQGKRCKSLTSIV
jgi:2-methylaconitate cis-trans-isomerase PrpF